MTNYLCTILPRRTLELCFSYRIKMYWLTFCLFQCILATPDKINIVGIFGPHEDSQVLAFNYAVQRINRNREILPSAKLIASVIRIPADDSFQASKKVCHLISSGVAAIFGPKSENTASHVQSICGAMEIPHIQTYWNDKLTEEAYSVNLYPYPDSLSAAYYDVATSLGWSNFTVLYDSNENLIRLQSLFKLKKWKIGLYELEGDDWRPLLKELKKLRVTKFVIAVDYEKIYNILKQANEIGMMNEYYSYLITSLDVNLISMQEFTSGRSNITALRLIDPTTEGIKKLAKSSFFGNPRHRNHFDSKLKSITTESALMYDAVHLFALALDDLIRSRTFDVVPLHCDVGKTWAHGNSLIKLMKWYTSNRYINQSMTYHGMDPYPSINIGQMAGIDQIDPYQSNFLYNRAINFAPDSNFYDQLSQYSESNLHGFEEVLIYGLSGLMTFDEDGFRSDFELEIIELDYTNGMTEVGRWTKSGGANYTRNYAEKTKVIASNLQNRSLIVTSALATPYVMKKNNSEKLVGKDKYEGFCIDLMEKISEYLKFNYTIIPTPGNSYGKKDPKTNEYDGMIGELINHRAHMAIVDFTITHEREEMIDFSMPFMDLGIAILYTKPKKKAPDLFFFMSPFDIDVWIYMATAYLGVSVLLFVLGRITPSEWDNPHPCIQDPEELENTITLSNAFWFTIGSLMQQGSDIAPKAAPTRIVSSIWWFFTLIMVSSYTANLAAFLVVTRMESPITGAEDLAKQSKIKYGCRGSGSTQSFFNNSQLSTHQKMYRAMLADPTVFVKSNEEGVEKVSVSDGNYAFLMESSSIEYNVERRCNLIQLGELLDAKSYGIGLPPGSPYTGEISSAILKMKESGELHDIKLKWWKKRDGGGKCKGDESSKSASKTTELELASVGGVFVVLLGGMVISALFAFIEFFWNARELATDENATFCEELGKEVQFIMKCSGNTRPIRKPGSSAPEDALMTYGSYNAGNYGYQPTLKKIQND